MFSRQSKIILRKVREVASKMNQYPNQFQGPEGPSLPTSEVVKRLRAFIAEGGYAPGDRIPAERELMGALDLTRNALRRGLDTLEQEGLIWRHVGKGTFVSGGPTVLGAAGLAELGRQLAPLRMMRARLCIESAIAREAAVNASAEAQDKIRLAMERTRAADSWSAYEAQDDRFHRAIAEAADNPLLLVLFDQLNQVRRTVAWDAVTRDSDRPPKDHSSFAQHEAILAAIAAHDLDAAYTAMRDHLSSVSARLFREP